MGEYGPRGGVHVCVRNDGRGGGGGIMRRRKAQTVKKRTVGCEPRGDGGPPRPPAT